jgi:hypothetical protein
VYHEVVPPGHSRLPEDRVQMVLTVCSDMDKLCPILSVAIAESDELNDLLTFNE